MNKNMRTVKRAVRGMRAVDGAGVQLVRVLGNNTMEDFDPFLMLDSFDSTDPNDYIKGFPTHPHRGIETVTYLYQGEMDHQDSLGNKGTINNGEVQWMTAGSGIMHSEMPQPTDRILGLQLWINLPKEEKMTQPKYFDIKKDDIAELVEDNYTARVISGEFKGAKGAVPHHLPARIMDIEINEGAEIEIETDPKNTVFIFTLLGDVEIADEIYREKTAILFDQGNAIKLKSVSNPCKVIYFEAPKLGESIAWGGPIVMNTEEELREAFRELRNGEFIKEEAI